MPRLLIKVRKSNWYGEFPSFVPPGDISASCLFDLRTNDNALSVWEIDDSGMNLDRVITALAASTDNVSNLDYVLFQASLVEKLRIRMVRIPGQTPDESANQEWHRDLVDLTGRKTLDLAITIHQESNATRVPEKIIKERIHKGIETKELDPAAFKTKMRQHLGLINS